MMKLMEFEETLLQKIYAFNQSNFPFRRGIEESFKERFFENPYSKDGLKNSAFVFENNKIYGQFLVLPNRFHYAKKSYDGVWGIDFIVDETMRGKGIGKKLGIKTLTLPNYTVVGISDASRFLHEKFGNQEIAVAERFIHFTNLFSPLRFIFKKKQFDRATVEYPSKINSKSNTIANKISNSENCIHKSYWNPDIVEWDRSKEFIKWRFFSTENKYGFYQSINKDFYFVVRKVKWKNLDVLLLVDYRYEIGKFSFEELYNLVLRLSSQLDCSATICVSSLENEKKILKKKLNIKFGDPFQIMTNCKEVVAQKSTQVTFADSDLDTFYGDNVW